MPSKYDYHFDPHGESTAALACQWVGSQQRVLELGCAAGAMTKVLSQHYHNTVTAVEYDATAAEHARPYADAVWVRDLNQPQALEQVGDGFDVVLMADVLEHLYAPERLLQRVQAVLQPKGKVVISVPNAAHAGLLAQQWCNRFDYTETGLLDRTHIRFFTAPTLYELLERAGFGIEQVAYLCAGPAHPEFATYWQQLPPRLYNQLLLHPPARPYQILMQARLNPQSPSIPLPAPPPWPPLSLKQKLRQLMGRRVE